MTRRDFVVGGTVAASLGQTAMAAVAQDNMVLRPAEARGKVDMGWLQSAHSFSFGQYFDPRHLQFESLRVINDDRVAAGQGFPMHGHDNFEIFSYILDGQLEHKDSMGNGSVVSKGGVQYMSAGTGVRHSEFNPSDSEPVAFLQIWLHPNVRDEAPAYAVLSAEDIDKDGRLALILSPDGRDGSLRVKSDADVYAATLDGEQVIDFALPEGHRGWVQVARGNVEVNGQALRRGDGLAIMSSGALEFSKGEDAEFLLFDMPILENG